MVYLRWQSRRTECRAWSHVCGQTVRPGTEGLTGFEDEAGLETLGNMTRQLVDRYSFLMGTSRQERDRLSKDYKHILHLRGELVHAKQSRLGHAERGYLRKVQEILSQVIWRELQNMHRDSDLQHLPSSLMSSRHFCEDRIATASRGKFVEVIGCCRLLLFGYAGLWFQ
jgi:hypothetical protein